MRVGSCSKPFNDSDVGTFGFGMADGDNIRCLARGLTEKLFNLE